MEEISFQEAYELENTIFIDLRSEDEYLDGTIPGAINLPLFNEEERRDIGSTYRQVSPKEAILKGVEYSSRKILDLVKTIDKLAEKGNIVLFCQKGGMRSQSLYKIANLINIKAYKLKEGYKGFRRYNIDALANYNLTGPLVTIYGCAGAGKTTVLQILKERGLPVIELEALAGHRGSVFGDIGLDKALGQKQFDASLWSNLQEFKNAPYLIIEGESKRLGNVYLPSFLLEPRSCGQNLLLEASLTERAQHISEEYLKGMPDNTIIHESRLALNKIEKRLIGQIGKSGFNNLLKMLEEKKFQELISALLVHYYDPLYTLAMKDIVFDLKINMKTPDYVADRIQDFLASKFPDNI